MEKKYRVRIMDDGRLVDRWLVNEKQKDVIEALIERDLFFDEVKIEFEEEKTESNVQQTNQNTFGDFSYNNEPEQKEEISPLTQNDITFDSMDDVYQDEYEEAALLPAGSDAGSGCNCRRHTGLAAG